MCKFETRLTFLLVKSTKGSLPKIRDTLDELEMRLDQAYNNVIINQILKKSTSKQRFQGKLIKKRLVVCLHEADLWAFFLVRSHT